MSRVTSRDNFWRPRRDPKKGFIYIYCLIDSGQSKSGIAYVAISVRRLIGCISKLVRWYGSRSNLGVLHHLWQHCIFPILASVLHILLVVVVYLLSNNFLTGKTELTAIIANFRQKAIILQYSLAKTSCLWNFLVPTYLGFIYKFPGYSPSFSCFRLFPKTAYLFKLLLIRQHLT